MTPTGHAAQTKNPGKRVSAAGASLPSNEEVSILAEQRTRVHLALAEKPHLWRRALYRSSLPASALRVGLALADRYLNRKSGRCDPSHETLAIECDMSVRTVRDGLAALRESKLLSTRKQGLGGTLAFYFAVPSNAAEIQQVVGDDQSGENPSLNPANLRKASDGFPASNLRGTSEGEPPNTVGEGCPPAAVVAPCAPPLDLARSSLHLAQPATVVGDGQPSMHTQEEKEEEVAIRYPSNPLDRARFIKEAIGENADYAVDDILDAWEGLNILTPQKMREIAMCSSRRQAS